MWIIFGVSAVILGLMNLNYSLSNKPNKWLGFASLSLTAMTIMAFYQDAANRVIVEDWSGLMDILPSTSTMLWLCLIASILINGYSLMRGREK